MLESVFRIASADIIDAKTVKKKGIVKGHPPQRIYRTIERELHGFLTSTTSDILARCIS